MRQRSRLRWMVLVFAGSCAVAVGTSVLADRWLTHAISDRILAPTQLPRRPVALVFGAAVGSMVLRERVGMAAALYHAGTVRHLLLSGDNRQSSYDEPKAMRRLALEMGVPDAALVLDYAGRRTYDSCARAHDIFHVEDPILVTQAFHLPRALYLCSHLGLAGAVGVAADDSAVHATAWQRGREVLASVRALIDVKLHHPRVLGGPSIPILDEEPSHAGNPG